MSASPADRKCSSPLRAAPSPASWAALACAANVARSSAGGRGGAGRGNSLRSISVLQEKGLASVYPDEMFNDQRAAFGIKRHELLKAAHAGFQVPTEEDDEPLALAAALRVADKPVRFVRP